MDFKDASECLKHGYLMARRGWGDTRQYIFYVKEMPFGYLHYHDGIIDPWSPSEGDTLEDDWELVV